MKPWRSTRADQIKVVVVITVTYAMRREQVGCPHNEACVPYSASRVLPNPCTAQTCPGPSVHHQQSAAESSVSGFTRYLTYHSVLHWLRLCFSKQAFTTGLGTGKYRRRKESNTVCIFSLLRYIANTTPHRISDLHLTVEMGKVQSTAVSKSVVMYCQSCHVSGGYWDAHPRFFSTK